MLDLRSASGFPPKERWYPLLNCKMNGSNRPEIKIGFGIGNLDSLSNNELNYSPPIKLITKSQDNMSNLDLSESQQKEVLTPKSNNKKYRGSNNYNSDKKSNNGNNNSNGNILEPVLTNDGFYQIGKGQDQFIFIISLIATYNLSKLVTEISNSPGSQSSTYHFCYSILGNEIKTEEFENINRPSFSIERVSIRFRSTQQELICFFEQLSNIKIELHKGTRAMAFSEIDLHELWREDKSNFSPIFIKNIPLFRMGNEDKTIISSEIQPQIMIVMCLQTINDNNSIDKIMLEVDKVIESSNMIEANSLLLNNNNNNNNNNNRKNNNRNANDDQIIENNLINENNNSFIEDTDQENRPINENVGNDDNNNNNNSNNNIIYSKESYDNNEIINNELIIPNHNTINNIDINNDNDNSNNNIKSIPDQQIIEQNNNENIVHIDYNNNNINPDIHEINENVIDELSFNIESIKDFTIKNVEFDYEHEQHPNLTMEEEIIIKNDNVNSVNETNEQIMIKNEENPGLTNSKLNIEYNIQEEDYQYDSNSFIPLDSTNLNLDNTENIQTDFIMGEGNTEILINNVATSIENQKEVTPSPGLVDKISIIEDQNSMDKFPSKLPISVTSNLKKSNEIITSNNKSSNGINDYNKVNNIIDNKAIPMPIPVDYVANSTNDNDNNNNINTFVNSNIKNDTKEKATVSALNLNKVTNFKSSTTQNLQNNPSSNEFKSNAAIVKTNSNSNDINQNNIWHKPNISINKNSNPNTINKTVNGIINKNNNNTLNRSNGNDKRIVNPRMIKVNYKNNNNNINQYNNNYNGNNEIFNLNTFCFQKSNPRVKSNDHSTAFATPRFEQSTVSENTSNMFQVINWHQYKFMIDLKCLRNIKWNGEAIYCKYLYLPFGSKLPHLTDPPITITPESQEISLPHSSYAYEFFMDPMVLANSLESIPLEVEIWQTNTQIHREIKVGQATFFMNEILGCPEITKNPKHGRQTHSIRQWTKDIPIFSIENIGVPLEKLAELKVVLQLEDFGLIEDPSPSSPIRQNSDPVSQATPTPYNYGKFILII